MRTFTLVFTLALCAAHAHADTVALDTTAASDGSVRDDSPFDGTFESVDSINPPTAFTIIGPGESRGIMEFVIAGIPSGATITGVEIDLRSNGAANDAEFFLYSGDGAVSVADATGGVSLGTFAVPVFPNDFIQALPTAAFQTLLDGGATHFGVRYEVAAGLNVDFLDFETGVAQNDASIAPHLNVTFTNPVPTPAAGALGLIGMAALLGRRHRRGRSAA